MTETAKDNNESELMEVIRNYGIDNQILEKKLATAIEALKNAYGEINSLNGSDNILEELEQALAEIGGEDE